MAVGQLNILHKRVVVIDGTEKSRWVRVGTMFPLKGGGFNICLDTLPTGPWDGTLIAKEPNEYGEKP